MTSLTLFSGRRLAAGVAALALAVGSVRQSGRFPKPLHLITFPADSISFSETFLFVDDHRFRLRTLDDGK